MEERGARGSLTRDRYLEEKYDKQHKFLAQDIDTKYATLRWVHASEASFLLFGLPVVYTSWFGGDHEEAKAEITKGLEKNIVAVLTMLEDELQKSKGKFLMGEKLTVADMTMHFSAQFMLAMGIDGGKKWPRIEEWLKDCEATEGYKRAVEKTGYSLG